MTFYFPGLGTAVNVAAILFGGLFGLFFGKFLTGNIRQTLQMSCAVVVIFIGINGTVSSMLNILPSGEIEIVGTMLLTGTLIIGGLVGEFLDIDKKFENFGVWLRKKFGSEGDNKFVEGFVTASLTVCIGAMAVVGAINDRLLQDCTVLYTKSVLDLVIIAVMTAGLGKGCIFSCVSVGIFQGTLTLLAGLLQPFMNEIALKNLSCIGSVLIFCIGINLMFGNKIRVANLLPALAVAVVWK